MAVRQKTPILRYYYRENDLICENCLCSSANHHFVHCSLSCYCISPITPIKSKLLRFRSETNLKSSMVTVFIFFLQMICPLTTPFKWYAHEWSGIHCGEYASRPNGWWTLWRGNRTHLHFGSIFRTKSTEKNIKTSNIRLTTLFTLNTCWHTNQISAGICSGMISLPSKNIGNITFGVPTNNLAEHTGLGLIRFVKNIGTHTAWLKFDAFKEYIYHGAVLLIPHGSNVDIYRYVPNQSVRNRVSVKEDKLWCCCIPKTLSNILNACQRHSMYHSNITFYFLF